MVIAIDGPAGAGKSTVARAVAQRLGFAYLDTGAMYRAVALISHETQQPPEKVAETFRIELGDSVLVDDRDVSEEIRSTEITEISSAIAQNLEVRTALVKKQRELVQDGNWVADGRDIGTVVAPDAELKIYLDATPEERARRRVAQIGGDYDTILKDQLIRDERDSAREHSPLKAADDAVTIDTTDLSFEQVVERVIELEERTR